MERIHGCRITLRKATIEDTENIYKNIYSDRNVLDMMFLPPSANLEEAYARVLRTIEFQKDKTLFYVELNATHEVIGVAGFKQEEPGIYCEAGIGLGSKYHHQGYGSEILELIMKTCFLDLDAKMFRYYSFDINKASIGLANKYHFVYESSEKEIRSYDQKEFVVNRYYKTREDYFNDIKRIKR